MRNITFDILKGILIVLVVLGHLVNGDSMLHTIIFSFHMPVFFMITGILSHWGATNREFILKRAKSYVVPYFSWCILLFLLFYIENPVKYIVRIVYGGAMNTTEYTYPFWFICCLFVSSVVFNRFWTSKKWVLIFLSAFLLGWYLVLHKIDIPVLPWSIEVVPFALMYFFLGIWTSRIESVAVQRYGASIYIFPVALACYFIGAHIYGSTDFTITMKTIKFNCFYLDLIYPATFYLALKGMSILMAKSDIIAKMFTYIGKSSLVIMFSHAAIANVAHKITPPTDQTLTEVLVITFVSVAYGCAIYAICSLNRFSSRLFLGK